MIEIQSLLLELDVHILTKGTLCISNFKIWENFTFINKVCIKFLVFTFGKNLRKSEFSNWIWMF